MGREIYVGSKPYLEDLIENEFDFRDDRFFEHEDFADDKFVLLDDLVDKERYWANINSAVRLFGGIIQDNGDGTVRVANGGGMWKREASSVEGVPIGECEPMTLNGAQGGKLFYSEFEGTPNLELTNNAYNYIFVVWDHTFDNGDGTYGKPIVYANTNFYLADWENDPAYYDFRDSHPELNLPARRSGNLHAFTLGRVYKMDNEITIRVCGTNGWNFNKRLQLFGEEFFPVIRARGLGIEPIAGTLKFNVTEGVMWAEMINRFTVREFNMEVGDTFFAWYRHSATETPLSIDEINTTYPLGLDGEEFAMLQSTVDNKYYRFIKGWNVIGPTIDVGNGLLDFGPKILNSIIGDVYTTHFSVQDLADNGVSITWNSGTGSVDLASTDGNPKYIRLEGSDSNEDVQLTYVEASYGNTVTTTFDTAVWDLPADGTPVTIGSVGDVQSLVQIDLIGGTGAWDIKHESYPIAESFFDTVPGNEYVMTFSSVNSVADFALKVGDEYQGNSIHDAVYTGTDLGVFNNEISITFTATSDVTFIWMESKENSTISEINVTIDMGDGPINVYHETFEANHISQWVEVDDYINSKKHITNSFPTLSDLATAHPTGFRNLSDGIDYVVLQLQATDAFYRYDAAFPAGDRWRFFGDKTTAHNYVTVAFIGNVAGMNAEWPNGYTGVINVIADVDENTEHYEYSGVIGDEGWKQVEGYVERNGWLRFYKQDGVDPLRYNNTTTNTLKYIPIGYYGVAWIYMVHDNTCHVVYGQDYYTNEQAKLAALPTPLPGLLAAYSTLVGKMTFTRGGTSFENAESPFLEKFVSSGVALHNDLAGLDGGSSSQNKYYHMDEIQYNQVSDWVANGVRDLTFRNEIEGNQTAVNNAMTFSKDLLTIQGSTVYTIPSDAIHYVLGNNGLRTWSDTE